MSEVVETGLPCPAPTCGSSDAFARYDDGHGYCFSCKHYETAEGEAPSSAPKQPKDKSLVPFGHYQAIPARSLNEATCEKFGYFIAEDDRGQKVQVAPYRNKAGQIVGQKVRSAGKKFRTTGDFKDATLFGQHLWRDGGKRILVVEGEIDAMSAYQMLGNWPVVSIPNGAQSAAKAVKASLEFLESYDVVIFGFDMDEPGREAVDECVRLLTPGKAHVMELPVKDANEMLVDGRIKEFVSAFWEARLYRPDGIVNGLDLWDQLTTEIELGRPYPWASLNDVTYGERFGELVTWTSGSGMGKSTAVAEIGYARLLEGQNVGYVALEENVRRSAQRMVGLHLNKPIHLPGNEVSKDELRRAYEETLGTGRFFTFDHFGSIQSESILSKLRFLAVGCGCRTIILDHLSIIVSGMEDNDDERKTIDRLMTNLRSLVEETGVSMHLVSHLRRPSGDKGHEQGAEISLAHLRGSHSIVQLSDIVIGLERNQQSEEDEVRDVANFRVLKNRYSGITGLAGSVRYDRVTGRLVPYVPEELALDDDLGSDF
ncbi:twinkle protein [Devosia enhydra]|uniref:Twinkle protein n=1 Tax=Devosia enhydra TaxID=665118 RepID=A0A1K2HVC5_9HYPH|nr:DnaB-like helicase C-terminal domain-containing protein [Devosia enhydra]SFZ81695.1 twinkle protein [Devosia enhydra]